MIKLESGIHVDPTKGVIHIPTFSPEAFNLPKEVQSQKKLANGATVITLPLHEDTMRLLGNIGLPTAGLEPMRYYYQMPLVEGKYPLYEHQIQSAGFLVAHQRGFNLSTMRVGKTAAAIVGADYLQKMKGEKSALILSTLTTLSDVWEKEITGLLPNASYQVVSGSRKEREKKLATDADFYITNFDGVKTMHKELVKMVKDGKISIVIVDELSHYANHRSGLWKALNSLINDRKNPIKYVWGLTGTPGKDPVPVYAQTKLIVPNSMKMTFTQWRALTMINTWGFTWEMKKEAPAMIGKVMQPAIRFNKDDIFDIPKPKRTFVFSPLTPEQKKVVEDLKRDLMALVTVGGTSKVAAVADNRAIAVNKMLQACTGAMRVDEDTVVRINMDSRLKDLKDLIDSTERKVVIFCAFKETINVLAEWCEAEGIEFSESHGGVTGLSRQKQIKEFQDENSNVKVLLAHPRTTAFGVELSVADTMIFFGPPMSGYMAFAQAVERMSSLKQTSSELRIYYFYGSAEEKSAFLAAETGEKDGTIINMLFEEMIE